MFSVLVEVYLTCWTGIKAPGYEDRRRERLSEKYGFKFTDEYADKNSN